MPADPLGGHCAGALMWHKDHMTGDASLHTVTGPRGERVESGRTLLCVGNSTTFEVDGLKITVEYPCPHHFGPWNEGDNTRDVLTRMRTCEVCGERETEPPPF